MKASSVTALLIGLTMGTPLRAQSVASDHVALPETYRSEVHFSTYKRGGITEELFASQQAIEAAKAGSPFPEGTVVTMEDFREGSLYRVLVMEKRAEWKGQSLSGNWRFGVYWPDGKPNLAEDLQRCESCHASAADRDHVFRKEDMLDD
ncbi:cytochrome P460 family protein [uncultured Cohaesibacter sp.]|uniref:cytochrome P460 family protein n=1 Tax=uncultured Cohaesibacter sp. TaxID=1002546 RepID=UPI0029C6198C|nr:cytochrome P460 family protein [uncultured Cohaesibacter sp.]